MSEATQAAGVTAERIEEIRAYVDKMDELTAIDHPGCVSDESDCIRDLLAALDAKEREVERLTSALADARRVALEEAAKVCDHIAIHAERRAAMHDNVAAKTAALDKMEAAQACAVSIRERPLPSGTDYSALSTQAKEDTGNG